MSKKRRESRDLGLNRFDCPYNSAVAKIKIFLLIGAVFIAITAPCFSQTVAFAPQGSTILRSQSGKVMKNMQILDTFACGPAGSSVANGLIYQTAAAANFSPIGATMGAAAVNQQVAKDWKQWLVTFLSEGALDAGIAGAGQIIKMPMQLTLSLVAGHSFMDKFSPQLLSTAPTPAAVFSILLDPTKVTQFTTTQPCVEATMFATYTRGSKAVGPINILTGPVVAPTSAVVGVAAHDGDEDEYAVIARRVSLIMAAHAEAARMYDKGAF